jgi:hypothetical protein
MAQVICNDGTLDVSNGGVMPCLAHGGVSGPTAGIKGAPAEPITAAPEEVVITTATEYTTAQKWLAIIGITAVCYFILYKAGSLK